MHIFQPVLCALLTLLSNAHHPKTIGGWPKYGEFHPFIILPSHIPQCIPHFPQLSPLLLFLAPGESAYSTPNHVPVLNTQLYCICTITKLRTGATGRQFSPHRILTHATYEYYNHAVSTKQYRVSTTEGSRVKPT